MVDGGDSPASLFDGLGVANITEPLVDSELFQLGMWFSRERADGQLQFHEPTHDGASQESSTSCD